MPESHRLLGYHWDGVFLVVNVREVADALVDVVREGWVADLSSGCYETTSLIRTAGLARGIPNVLALT